MQVQRRLGAIRRLLLIAIPLALGLMLFFPLTSEAHAVLLRSDPARDAVLNEAPSQVRMWFSEDLNPTFSTASVMNSSNHRVDTGQAHVSSNDPREMDVQLSPNLPTSVYIVIWRTQSAADGHVLSGSFLFTVALPGDPVPTASGLNSGQTSASGGAATGQLDGPTLFSLIMITLVELGVVFWMGAQLWRTFVLQLAEDDQPEQAAIRQREEERFERRFSLPALGVLFLANIGVLLGLSLSLTNGQWSQVFVPSNLIGLISHGQFGTYWIMRELVIVLAIAISVYTLLARQLAKGVRAALSWINLVLGLALLIAVALSGHAAAVSGSIATFAILGDWLHLLAASLWVGGMMYIATIYLPVLQPDSLIERARSLLTTLPRFSPLAITGVIIMSLTGPLNATVHMTSWDQLYTTAYGRALVVKVLLVGGLLLTSAIHVLRLRPQLAKTYQQYLTTRKDSQATAQQVKMLEMSVSGQTRRLTNILRWEPLLGVAVLLCTGLMNVFAGTLLPATTAQTPGIQSPGSTASTFSTTAHTSDGKFQVKITISPNTFGPNAFTATVMDQNNQPDTNVGVSLYLTGADMDMGTEVVNLQPDGKGGFSGHGDLTMGGRWWVRFQIRTPDNTLHENRVLITVQG
ncbi:MAG TPA: copper resistance protein CopC [Ktedonosporobacter sp.]|jgi:copper transport protein|nr:copper resistance protein CopC [Ktedonosporobacter sp.]